VHGSALLLEHSCLDYSVDSFLNFFLRTGLLEGADWGGEGGGGDLALNVLALLYKVSSLLEFSIAGKERRRR